MGGAQQEILSETFRLLASRLPLLLGLAAAVGVAILAEPLLARGLPARALRWLRRVLVAGAVGMGLWLAWRVLWLADDAFISFRYARNFARGEGLVYNTGEWVEGYTNFLWTALLGVLGRVGVDIPNAGLFGNLACFVLAMITVSVTVRRIDGRAAIPFSAVALAGLAPFHTFASSGLETMPLALLGAAAMWASTRRNGAAWAGVMCVLGALTRPDFLLVYGCMGLALTVEDLAFGAGPPRRRIAWRRLAVFAAPLGLVYLPYFLVRWHAYGDFLPNTFYVKSGGLSYWAQGFVYLVHFAATSGAWAWLPLFVVALAGRSRTRDELRLRAFAGLTFVVYGAYVVKVGGDFMEHRFFVPLLPLVAMATEVGLRARMRDVRSVRGEVASAAWVAAALAVAFVPIRLIGPGEKRWFMAAEHTFYPVDGVFPLALGSGYARAGEKLHRAFTEAGARPRIVGDAIGMLGYYSDLPIVDALGLTNRRIAHKPLSRRGRPGHEKSGTPEELQEDGAQLSLWPLWGEAWREQTRVRVGSLELFLVRLDPPIVDALEKAKVAVPNPWAQLSKLVHEGTRDDVLAAVPFYRSFLTGRGDREALLGLLRGRLAEIADFEEGLPPDARETGKQLHVLRGQPPRGGSGSGWLASLGMGRGRVEIPIASIRSREIRFALGGAPSPEVKIRLVVDGQTVREASPAGGPGLVPMAWDVSELLGKPAVVSIDDDDPSPEVGILVDAIHFASREGGDVRGRIAKWRSGRGGDPASLAREAERYLPAGDPDRTALEAAFEERWTLDDDLPAGTNLIGNAFGNGPVSGAVDGQQPLAGWQGRRLLDSYHSRDGSVGRVEFPPRVLSGGPISVLVGGGSNCDETYVGLEVEGEVVARVCGREDEVLRPATLPTRKWAGKTGRVVVVDRSRGPWGHILADDVIFLRPQGNVRSAVGSKP